MIVCPCSLQTLWWSSNMWQKINGGMPKRKGTEFEEATASDKKKPSQWYKHEYTELWNCLKPSTKGDTFVWCSTCQTDFSCAHGGRFDCNNLDITHRYKQTIIFNKERYDIHDIYCRKRYLLFQAFLEEGVPSVPLANLTKTTLKSRKKITPIGQQFFSKVQFFS